jgi:hypothetical protein
MAQLEPRAIKNELLEWSLGLWAHSIKKEGELFRWTGAFHQPSRNGGKVQVVDFGLISQGAFTAIYDLLRGIRTILEKRSEK